MAGHLENFPSCLAPAPYMIGFDLRNLPVLYYLKFASTFTSHFLTGPRLWTVGGIGERLRALYGGRLKERSDVRAEAARPRPLRGQRGHLRGPDDGGQRARH